MDHRLDKRYKEMGMVGYVDSSYAGNLKDKKSIIGYYFIFGEVIVTWCNKRQCTISTSSLEAKYVAISQRTRKGM